MTETIHACPPGLSGVTPCCGKTPFELSRTDRMTVDPQAVTCTNAPAPGLMQCPNCGPTPTEPHPHQPGDRCSNCKTHAPGVAPIPGRCNGCGHTDDEGCGCPAHAFVSREHCHRCDGTWLIKSAAPAPVCSGTDGFCLGVHGFHRHAPVPGDSDGTDREQLLARLDAPVDGRAPWCCNGNAEDCRLCTDPNPPYPWICPGHPATDENKARVNSPAPDGLRDLYAAAVHATSVCEAGQPTSCGGGCTDVAIAVLVVRDEELQRLRADLKRAEDELTRLHTADSADAAAGSYAHRAERAEAERDALQDRLEFTEAALSRIRDRLEVQVVRETKRAEQAEAAFAAEQDISRRLLEQRQEMAAERFAWQERGDRAEAAVERLHEDIAYRDRKIEGTQAANDRVRDLADRWENALLPDRPYARALRDALDEPSDGAGADTPRPCGDVLEHPGHQFMRLDVLFNCPGNTPEDPS